MAKHALITGERPGATLHLRFLDNGRRIAPRDLPSRIGRLPARATIGDHIAELIDILDEIDGDPDLEDSEAGDEVDDRGNYLGRYVDMARDDDLECSAWTEWHTRGWDKDIFRSSLRHEDDEDDDPAEDDDPDSCQAGDDGCGEVWRMGVLHWGSEWEELGI